MYKLTTLIAALALSTPALASFSDGNEDLYGWAASESALRGQVTAAQPGIGDLSPRPEDVVRTRRDTLHADRPARAFASPKQRLNKY